MTQIIQHLLNTSHPFQIAKLLQQHLGNALLPVRTLAAPPRPATPPKKRKGGSNKVASKFGGMHDKVGNEADAAQATEGDARSWLDDARPGTQQPEAEEWLTAAPPGVEGGRTASVVAAAAAAAPPSS